MESIVGPRLSRSSSRYAGAGAGAGGLAPPPVVFKGPVRKWKKQWEWVSSNPTKNNTNNRHSATLFLCRWTPLSASHHHQHPQRRRFRYTPIVPLEKKEADKKTSFEVKTTKTMQPEGSMSPGADVIFGTQNDDDIFVEEAQELSEDQSDSNRSLDSGTYSKGERKNLGFDGQSGKISWKE